MLSQVVLYFMLQTWDIFFIPDCIKYLYFMPDNIGFLNIDRLKIIPI